MPQLHGRKNLQYMQPEFFYLFVTFNWVKWYIIGQQSGQQDDLKWANLKECVQNPGPNILVGLKSGKVSPFISQRPTDCMAQGKMEEHIFIASLSAQLAGGKATIGCFGNKAKI